eukprot:14170898-Ditylum_brightwellii.AAC.1
MSDSASSLKRQRRTNPESKEVVQIETPSKRKLSEGANEPALPSPSPLLPTFQLQHTRFPQEESGQEDVV